MDNIAELIQQRRLQMLVHSCIYYHLNRNIISDRQWDKWARELVELQSKYPEISKKVIWYEAFKDWDASTGAFLPITDEWVVQKAHYVLKITGHNVDSKAVQGTIRSDKVTTKNQNISKIKSTKSARKALF